MKNNDDQSTRKATVDQIKMQAVVCNYGLPENAHILGWDKLSIEDARREFSAIRELWVRLDLFVATGESSKGSIDFPEAKRRIDYELLGKRPQKSSVLFKALTREKRK